MAGDLPRKGLGQPSSQAFMYGAMAQNLTVTTQDSRVQFEGNWTIQESGYYKFTTQIGASASLTFPGKFALFNSLSFFY